MRMRHALSKLTATGLLVFCLSTGAHAAPIAAGSTVDGKTIGEWTAEWWIWALSFPVNNSPLLDTTGSLASVGDVGPVFFLAGTLGSEPVTRTFAVPGDKHILFPLINRFSSEEGTVEEMRDDLDQFIGGVTDLHATVDGVPILNLFSHRELSPVFDLTLPENNVFDAPARVYGPSVSDGYWLMLEPLGPGSHTIRFGGAVAGTPASPPFSVDVTYAVPEPASFGLAASAVAMCFLARVRRRRSRS
jgi:hypothetical protein